MKKKLLITPCDHRNQHEILTGFRITIEQEGIAQPFFEFFCFYGKTFLRPTSLHIETASSSAAAAAPSSSTASMLMLRRAQQKEFVFYFDSNELFMQCFQDSQLQYFGSMIAKQGELTPDYELNLRKEHKFKMNIPLSELHSFLERLFNALQLFDRSSQYEDDSNFSDKLQTQIERIAPTHAALPCAKSDRRASAFDTTSIEKAFTALHVNGRRNRYDESEDEDEDEMSVDDIEEASDRDEDADDDEVAPSEKEAQEEAPSNRPPEQKRRRVEEASTPPAWLMMPG